jgi:flagellar biosynthesis protein FliP
MTALTFIPAAVLMMTSFTRIIIVLSMLRHAMGTQTSPPNQILIGMSLFLTFFIMSPVFETVYKEAIGPYMNGNLDSTLTPKTYLGSCRSPHRAPQEAASATALARLLQSFWNFHLHVARPAWWWRQEPH